MVTLFLEIVIGTPASPGLFGPTAAYYCTVKQQGRLTLHLHGIAFTKKKLSPLEIKERLLDPASDFQTCLITYLESVRVGEFLTGTKNQVTEAVRVAESSPSYVSPELTLPIPPPVACGCNREDCETCNRYNEWFQSYNFTVDDLLLKSNVHDCNRAMKADGSIDWDKFEISCLNNKYRRCKARFPRATFKETIVDLTTGHLSLKKLEEWLNDISPALTYLMRCNTDVTCLLSGTAIKAVICYVADYITKTGLKTHVVFDGIKAIFNKNTELLNGSQSDKEKSRRLLTQMVNLLSTKLKLGGPMICMYLLQHPDHYCSHEFVPFYWKSFVSEARLYWYSEDPRSDNKVVLIRRNGKLIGLSSTFDYMHRPEVHENYNLYEWLRRFKRVKRPRKKQSPKELDSDDDPYPSDTESAQKSDGLLRFISGHPLESTHVVSVTREFEKVVPNFYGPPLPRPDKGDREFYCCCMLTFFKPWRSGKDLKSEIESWDMAFDGYQFSEGDLLHMKNINLRYECLDSRDDYRAQLKAGG
ncbi:hypothetical protein GYMLUDRAFT_170252, partial [Collybiopsis luxurians FD-317 M1]